MESSSCSRTFLPHWQHQKWSSKCLYEDKLECLSGWDLEDFECGTYRRLYTETDVSTVMQVQHRTIDHEKQMHKEFFSVISLPCGSNMHRPINRMHSCTVRAKKTHACLFHFHSIFSVIWIGIKWTGDAMKVGPTVILQKLDIWHIQSTLPGILHLWQHGVSA